GWRGPPVWTKTAKAGRGPAHACPMDGGYEAAECRIPLSASIPRKYSIRGHESRAPSRRDRGIIKLSLSEVYDAHDNARSDAAPQGLAQVELGHRGGLFRAALHSQLPERFGRRRGQ